MAASTAHALMVDKIEPGNWAVTIGDQAAFDIFHFSTERDAQRFVRASDYAFKRSRTR